MLSVACLIRHPGLLASASWYFTDSSEASPPNQGFHPTQPTFPHRAQNPVWSTLWSSCGQMRRLPPAGINSGCKREPVSPIVAAASLVQLGSHPKSLIPGF